MILVLAMFLVLLGVGNSTPLIRNWTLAEIDDALTNTDLAPYELKSLVEQIREGVYPNFIENRLLKSPTGKDKWTNLQLNTEIDKIDKGLTRNFPEYRKTLMSAYTYSLWHQKGSVYVRKPSKLIQTWDMKDLDKYLDNNYKMRKRPFYKQVRDHRNMLIDANKKGKQWENIPMLVIPEYYYDAVPSHELND